MAFSPETARAMAIACSRVCRLLNIPVSATAAREAIAMYVVATARNGETDVGALRDRIIHGLKQSGTGC